MKTKTIVILVVLVGCARPSEKSLFEQKDSLDTIGKEIMNALAVGDYTILERYVHPVKGIRFSPYPSVNKKDDVIVTRSILENLLSRDTIIRWGYFDGSGYPIEMTFKNYITKYIVIDNCLSAFEVTIGEIKQRGNMLDNCSEIYPDTQIIEYFCGGRDNKYEGMDWVAIKFVFDQYENQSFLIGIVHNGWTI